MPGWGELLRHGNAARTAVVTGGMVLHAVNVFIATTILPTVVDEIGGLRFFAWATTLYVVGSLFGAVACPRLLRRGARPTYRVALTLFALGTAACALAPTMPVLLAGGSSRASGPGCCRRCRSPRSGFCSRPRSGAARWARSRSPGVR